MDIIYRGGFSDISIPTGQKIGINCQFGTAVVYYRTQNNSPKLFYEQTRVVKDVLYLGPFSDDRVVRVEALDADTIFDVAINPYVVTISNLNWKQSARAATVSAGTLSSSFSAGQTVDGVVLVADDRIVIKDQADSTENGIYTVNSSGAPTRAEDANTGDELVAATISVREGTVNADVDLICTNNSITIGSTNITFVNKSTTTNHNLLAGLQGGTSSQYYHLTSAEYTDFQAMNAAGLEDLTASEVTQIGNIGATSISSTQWGYLGALDQGLTSSSNVDFATVDTTGSVGVGTTSPNISSSNIAATVQTNLTNGQTAAVEMYSAGVQASEDVVGRLVYANSNATGFADRIVGKIEVKGDSNGGAGNDAHQMSFFIGNTGGTLSEVLTIDRIGTIYTIGGIVVDAGTTGVVINNAGSIEIISTIPFIDFKTGEGEDFDCRIIQVSNGLDFYTGGDGSATIAFNIDANENVVCGNAAIATTATDGFLYIPSCAGPPTGTPTTKTGRVPIVFDTTNNDLYIYDGGWVSVALT